MAQIRRELHEDVRGVIVSAEVAADWRNYVRQYPWVAVGAAAAIGYFVVPRRRKIVVQAPETTVVTTTATEKKKERRAGLLGTIFGAVAPLALRFGQNYAAHYFEQWLSQQMAMMSPAMGAPGGPQSQSQGQSTHERWRGGSQNP
jgi:hypothetical protein